ncbi:hypothetical protein LguiA_026640 [Lonicera macranthoides]
MAVYIGKIVLDKGWLAARSTDVNYNGVQLITTYPPSGSQTSPPWMEVVIEKRWRNGRI